MDLSTHDSPLLPLIPCQTCAAGRATLHGRICERCAARVDAELDIDVLTLGGAP